jgi:FSR family fosmidomycin resistance protein-like MFS transporter
VSAVAAVLAVRLVDELAAFLPAGTLESFRADLGLTYAQTGIVLAAIAPGALAGAGFAAATDRYSRRVISAGGAVGFAAALAAFAVGGSFEVLAAAAFAMGTASTAMVEAAEVALVDLVAEEDLRRSLARCNLLATFGDLLGPALIAGAAALGLSWRAVFAAGSGVLALYGLVLGAAPLPAPAGSQAEPGGPRSALRGILRDPAVWVVGLLGLLMSPFDEVLLGFVIALLEHDRGASPALATTVALVGVSGGLLSFTVLARKFEDVDDGRLLLGSAAAMTTGVLTVALIPSVAAVTAGAFVVSVGLNLGWLALQHRSLTLRPGEVGTTRAVVATIEFTGFWIPVAIGLLADRTGLPAAIGAFGLLGGAMAALTWGDSRWRRTTSS